jgi:hypothetical protein
MPGRMFFFLKMMLLLITGFVLNAGAAKNDI